jgi:hypothetical protein
LFKKEIHELRKKNSFQGYFYEKCDFIWLFGVKAFLGKKNILQIKVSQTIVRTV